MKNVRFKASVLVVASLALGACGTGTESSAPAGGDGRNTARRGDNGLPYIGHSPNLTGIAVDPQTGTPWISSSQQISRGLITGGIAKLDESNGVWSVDSTFPRVNGSVSAIDVDPDSGEVFVGGNFVIESDTLVKNIAGIKRDGSVNDLGGISLNAPVLDVEVQGFDVYLAGGFRTVIARRLSGTVATGLVSYNRGTGVVRRIQLPGKSEFTTAVENVIVHDSGPATLAALHIRDRSTNTWAIETYNLDTLEMIGLRGRSSQRIPFADLGNGIFAYSVPGTGRITFENLVTGAEIGFFNLPSTQQLNGIVSTGSALRLWVTEGGGRWRFVDLDPQTRQVIGIHALRTFGEFDNVSSSANMLWASGDRTLMSNGELFVARRLGGGFFTNSVFTVTSDGDASNSYLLNDAAATSTGFVVGGSFVTTAPDLLGKTVKLNEANDAETPGVEIRDASSPAWDQPRVVAATPLGLVARTSSKILLYRPGTTSDPVTVATAEGNDTQYGCGLNIGDVEWMAGKLFVAGCWATLTVGSTETPRNAVSIDLANLSLVGRFDVGNAVQIAALDRADTRVAVISRVTTNANQYTMKHFLQSGASAPGTARSIQGDVKDLVPVGTSTFVVGGWHLSLDSKLPTSPLWQVDPYVRTQDEPGTNPRDRQITWVTRPINSMLAVNDPAFGYRLYIGMNAFPRSDNRGFEPTLVAANGRLENISGLEVITSAAVRDIAGTGETLWLAGDFQTITVDGAVFQASGVSGFTNFSNRELITRPLTPVAENPTLIENPSGEPDSGDGTTEPAPVEEPETPVAALPVPAASQPPLPTSGTPAAGEFAFDNGESTTRAVVDQGGTISLEPAVDPGRPMVTKVTPGSRTVRVAYTPVNGTNTYKVIAISGKTTKTCRTTTLACTVKKLDPWRKWTFQVEATGNFGVATSDYSPSMKPFVKVKKGSSPRLTSIVKPGAKGKATWRASGACKVSGSKLTTPKRAVRCTLRVKAGKTTRTVSIRVN
ncbi:MAG: hypothetical protein ACO3RB_02985 [Ilumatobacteraceae bacterium]